MIYGNLTDRVEAQRAFVNVLKESAATAVKSAEAAEEELRDLEQQLAALDKPKPKRVVIVYESSDGDFDLAKCARQELTLDQALVYRVATATGIPFLYARDVIRELFGVEVPQ